MRKPIVGTLSQLLQPGKGITKGRWVGLTSRDELAGKLSLHEGVSPLRTWRPDAFSQERHDGSMESRIVDTVRSGIIALVDQFAGRAVNI